MKKKKEIIMVSLFIIIQTVIFIIVGMNKQYIHMDEAYSLGLSSYEKTEIQNNEDFYNQWHSKEYYEDYLAVQDDEIGKYSQVYENQKNDVHPPFYYFLLRMAMGFTEGHFSMWSGIILNIIIYIFITLFMYFILKELFKNEKNRDIKSVILAFMSSITMASLTNVIYIRMYALLTLMILITTFMHIRLWKSKKVSIQLYIGIGLVAFIGSLTHYYYLFYLMMMYLLFLIKYIKERKGKLLLLYTITMIVAGGSSLLIFPYSIQHMFFGYRGQGVLHNLMNGPVVLFNILLYIFKMNYYGFNNILSIIIIFMIILFASYKKSQKNSIEKNTENKSILKIIYLPTIFYFLVVAVASPWIELRYIMPVCGLLFILVMYYLYQLLRRNSSERRSNITMLVLFGIIIITPFILKIEPEVLYSEKKEIVQKVSRELNVPTIYLLNSKNNRFLDDILLFSKIEESYVAKDIEYNRENLQTIIAEKDISKGIIVVINEGQDNDEILKLVKQATGLKNVEHQKRMNACDIYYVN